jgi:hypothetical protein
MTSCRQHPDELCKYCARFRDGFCHLDDLAPCRPVIRDDGQQPAPCTPEETERAKTRVLAFVVAFFLAVAALLLLANRYRPADRDSSPVERREPVSTTAILRERNRAAESPLSEWQLLTLAIAYTESRCNPDSVGKDGDRGILQITPVYIREVNRLAGTHYRPEDAFDPATAVEIFERMQDCKNPDRSPDIALALHNRGAGYRARVLENLELIRRYEAARKTITDK